MPLELDHVIIAVDDLDIAARALYGEHGLDSVEGGRHAGLGTANRIIPLGDNYLELLAVVDQEEGRASPTGQVVLAHVAAGRRLMGWMVRTTDIEADAARLGLVVGDYRRTRPDGVVLTWRLAMDGSAMGDPSVPTFIQWDVPPDQHPAAMAVNHTSQPGTVAWIEATGDEAHVRTRVGDASFLRMTPGPPALVAVGVSTPDGPIVIR